tara:strand:+ start:1945 stop:2175 length:231 start_codon:yes stop_codon:yes gene_type:complete
MQSALVIMFSCGCLNSNAVNRGRSTSMNSNYTKLFKDTVKLYFNGFFSKSFRSKSTLDDTYLKAQIKTIKEYINNL